MKNILSIIVFFVLSSNASAQVWVENNATWYYEYSGGFFGGLRKLSHNGDTLLGGQLSKSIQVDDYQFVMMGPNGPMLQTSNNTLEEIYMYSSGDSVFWWTNGEYQLLYNFNAQINDTWIIDIGPTGWSLCDDTSRVKVVDVGIETVQGNDFRFIDLEPIDGSHYHLGGRFYDRFGGGSYLLPLERICDSTIITEYYMFNGVRCFEDDSLSLNFVGEECDYWITHAGMDENQNDLILVYPNPVTSQVQFSGSQIKSVVVTNSIGEFQLCFELSNDQTIELSNLSPGVYFLNCITSDDRKLTKRIILQ